MLIYRTLLIEHCHNGGCDHRARITHPRKNAITLAQVSAGTREDCIRKAIAEVDQLFQQKRLQRQRLQQRRHQLHTQLQAVLARQLPMPTLLASFKHLTTRQQAHVRDKLFNAALAGAPLHLPPVMQLDPEQRRCLASVRYKGHGRLLREPLLSRQRRSHCYACRTHLDSEIELQCSACKWMLCSCGACGCQYHGPYG